MSDKQNKKLFDQMPPENMDAEKHIISGLLLDPSLIDEVLESMSVTDFYHLPNQNIFKAIKIIHEAGIVPEIVSIKDELIKSGDLDNSGGKAYLLELMDIFTPTSGQNLNYYVNTVKEAAIRRGIIKAAYTIMQTAYDDGDIGQVYKLIEGFKEILDSKKSKKPYVNLVDLVPECSRHIDEMVKGRESAKGLKTGFIDIDTMLGGLNSGDLIIIAARPSMGKTSLSTNIAINNAFHDKAILIFSIETSAEQLLWRMVIQLSRVDSQKIKNGRLSQTDWERIMKALSDLSGFTIAINDDGNQSPYDLARKARIFKQDKGFIDLIIVDYLQLMNAGKWSGNRNEEITAISRGLKLLAKEMDCPVIALSQLSREVEKRTNNRPKLSDLRDSGAIEQDADVVVFIYREEAYKKGSEKENIAEINIEKQRDGPTGTAELVFLKSSMCFLDKARQND